MKAKLAALTACLVGFALVAGCGSGDDAGTGGSDEIVYGAQIDLTGPAAFAGIGARLGIELAIDQINEHGGINGRKLKLVVADSATDPAKGALAVRKLVEQDKVAFIHSAASSTSTVGAAPVVEQLNVPMISSMASDPKLLESAPKNMYLASPTPHTVTARFISSFALEEFQPKSVAILMDTATAHTPIVRETILEEMAKANVPVVADLTVKQGDTNFGSQILELRQSDPDLVFTLGYASVIGEFVKDARAAGLDQQFVGDYGQVAQDMLNITGEAGEGYISVWMGKVYLDDPDPEMQAFLKAFKEKFPDADQAYPNFGTVQAYTDTFVIADVIRRSGDTITPDAIRKALDETENFNPGEDEHFDYAAAIGRPLSWTDGSHIGSDQLTPLVIRGGKWARYEQ
jgi:branched-chain amino acid transport system substrate-binding protein